jgi:hypothetical protein
MNDFYQLAAVISPFISASLAGALTYFYSTKTKRKEYLYQNRIEAFKQIFAKISALKKYCAGKIASYGGHEFSPFWAEGPGGLHHRTEIAEAALMNQIFLSKASQRVIDELIDDLGMMCNIDLQISSNSELDYSSIYVTTLARSEQCLELLYTELDLD